MNLTNNGRNLLKEFEGFRSKPYLDSAGVPTIGYGSTFYANNQPVSMDDEPITETQAEHLMLKVLVRFEEAVSTLVKVPINQNQFDALVLLTYNIGIGAFQGSTLLKRLNEGNYSAAADQFKWWRLADGKVLKGLVTRRAKEKALFLMKPQQETQMLSGYKTYIGIIISLLSALAAALGKDWGIDWSGLEVAIANMIGAAISVYGYIKKEPKTDA